jgi:hypothetical protein
LLFIDETSSYSHNVQKENTMPEARCLDLENPQKRTPGDAVQKKRGKEKE